MLTEALTEEAIHATFTDELARAERLYAHWEHPCTGLSFSRARRILGQAHGNGTVKLSTLFIGTPARRDLIDTIRHELAHLIAGLRAGHGARWRQIARNLGAQPRATGDARCEVLRRRMDDAPFTLYAVLAGGEEVAVKPAYRRSREYENYRYNRFGRRYYYRGEAVQYFRYHPRQGWPRE